MKIKSVTDKINEELKTRLDSDDDTDDDNDARVVDFDEYDVPGSRNNDFRKRNVKLLSEQSNRYKGKIISRKELKVDEESDELQCSEEEYDDKNESSSPRDQYNESDESGMENDSENNEQSEMESSLDDYERSSDSENNNIENTVVEKKRKEAEIQKGVCVQNQLRIWERLLEIRILTQKLLNKSNQLPFQNDRSDYTSETAKQTMNNTCILLQNLLELKNSLTYQFSELRSHMKRSLQDTSTLNACESVEPPLKRIALRLEDQHNLMRSYRNAVLLKWDDRTKLLTPGAGAKKKIDEEFDVVRKIENAMLNREVLISKSRMIRSSDTQTRDEPAEDQNKKEETKSSDPNIYDDSDFYHQQLRQLIEFKANSSSNVAEVTKQIMELQNIRQKMKKKVDTRASKGRKIRYIVHKKIVNFMAPDDTISINWPDESKDELYKSLFAT